MEEWEWEIDPRYHWFRWELGAIPRYKDLLFRLVRRDLLANYQQTILGPFWILLQPVLTMPISGLLCDISWDLVFYVFGILVTASIEYILYLHSPPPKFFLLFVINV